MKISTIINMLNKTMSKHGDIDILISIGADHEYFKTFGNNGTSIAYVVLVSQLTRFIKNL